VIQLRPYQRESIDAVYDHWAEGGGDALIVIPTGGGKSLIIAQLLKELRITYPLMRIAVVTHVKELIAQNYAELIGVWPEAPAGIYSAGIGRRDTHHPILFCGIQSVWDKANRLGQFDLVLIDEAHLISRKANSMYGKFFEALRCSYPDMRLLGLTATPYRLDSGRLDRGDDRLFEKIVYEANVYDLIEQGYLSPLISKATAAEINTYGVHKRGGEFIAGELEQAAMADNLVRRAAEEIVARGHDRKAWLCFCSGVDHAQAMRDALRDLGIHAEELNGTTPKDERDRLIKAFRQGAIKCLTSVNVLSIGFNVPHVDLIALLRPTESAGLYTQQVGRGFRKAPGKQNALILDFAGNVRKHGPVNMVVAADKKTKAVGEVEQIPCKECPNCQSYVPISLRVCNYCEYAWPQKDQVKHAARPDTDVEIVVKAPASETGWQEIDRVDYSIHRKIMKPPTLCVTYSIGKNAARQWLGFSYPEASYPRKKACDFWIAAGGKLPLPKDTQSAFDRIHELNQPEKAYIEKDGKYLVPKRVTHKKKEQAA
jgi:DNA repair protein RadD